MVKRRAFTMVELVFVIVIIGILSAIAIPKLAATRDDAVITSAINTVSSVRSSMMSERQKRILRGDFTPITALHQDGSGYVFDLFSADQDGNQANVLEYPISTCTSLGKDSECWEVGANNEYSFNMPNGQAVDFNITNGKFTCKEPTSENCKLLTK